LYDRLSLSEAVAEVTPDFRALLVSVYHITS
jgi:hypothetical protein